MEKVRGYFQTLYQREEPYPPGLPLDTHVKPAKVNNEIPSEAKLEVAVRCLRLHRVGSHTHFRADHSKKWQMEAYPGEQLKTPPQRERWLYLVDIVQEGTVPVHQGPGTVPS